jgi:hypothetical protein
MCSDAAIHIAVWYFGIKQEAPLRRQKSTEVDKYRPKINQSWQKSTKVISCQQKSTLFHQE